MSTEGDVRKYFWLKIFESSFAKVALEPSNEMLGSSSLQSTEGHNGEAWQSLGHCWEDVASLSLSVNRQCSWIQWRVFVLGYRSTNTTSSDTETPSGGQSIFTASWSRHKTNKHLHGHCSIVSPRWKAARWFCLKQSDYLLIINYFTGPSFSFFVPAPRLLLTSTTKKVLFIKLLPAAVSCHL